MYKLLYFSFSLNNKRISGVSDKDTVQVAVFDPHEVNSAVGQHGAEQPLLLVLHEQRHEVVDLRHVHIAFVVPTYQHLGGQNNTTWLSDICMFNISRFISW